MNTNHVRGYAMGKLLTVLVLLIPVLSTGGCATVVKGTTQAISVETEPPGATCRLFREGATIAVVNLTPGSVTIGKDKDAVDVRCELDGHLPSSESLESSFQGWTLGNAVLGGLIGVAIDAGSGAMREYPTSIRVRLVPKRFDSIAARDSYFQRLEADVQSAFEHKSREPTYACRTGTCRQKLKKLEEQREHQLARIEELKSSVHIGEP
jgi:hypothetical protein